MSKVQTFVCTLDITPNDHIDPPDMAGFNRLFPIISFLFYFFSKVPVVYCDSSLIVSRIHEQLNQFRTSKCVEEKPGQWVLFC